MSANIGSNIALSGKSTKMLNIDEAYGPWNSTSEAETDLDDADRLVPGITIGVWKDNTLKEIKEYWYQNGAWVEKQSGAGGSNIEVDESDGVLTLTIS